MIYILFAIFVFGMLVAVHELGHFIAAKASNIKVTEYAIGMGPAIFRFRKGDFFRIFNFFVFGNKEIEKAEPGNPKHETAYSLRLFPIGGFCAMEGEDAESPDPRSFQRAKKFKRFITLAAGSIMNLILGWLIVLILLMSTNIMPSNLLNRTYDGFPHSDIILAGDRIVQVNGTATGTSGQVSQALADGQGAPFTLVIERDGQQIVLNDLNLDRRTYVIEGQTVEMIGLEFASRPLTFTEAVPQTSKHCIEFVAEVYRGVGQLVTGQVNVNEMAGPVGMATIISTEARESMSTAWSLVALISINLAVMNMLPFPALDGGRIVFLLIEAVRGKPIKQKYEAYINAAGLIILLGLMVFVSFGDIRRLF